MDVAGILLKHRLLTFDQCELVRRQANGSRVDRYVVDQQWATERAVLTALGEEFGIPAGRAEADAIEADLLDKFSIREVFRHEVLPIQRRGHVVVVATSDPFSLEALDELSCVTGFPLEPAFARQEDIVRLIKERLGVGGDTIDDLVAQRAEEGVELFADRRRGRIWTFRRADVGRQAGQRTADRSDRPVRQRRPRRAGGERAAGPLPHRRHACASNRCRRKSTASARRSSAALKIMAQLNIAEKRLPQDGRIKLRVQGREIDVRVSIIPMLHGEGVVLRLLDKGRMIFDLDSVGMPEPMCTAVPQLITKPHGIILVTGPTGSGKTTTLYSALNEIKSRDDQDHHHRRPGRVPAGRASTRSRCTPRSA